MSQAESDLAQFVMDALGGDSAKAEPVEEVQTLDTEAGEETVDSEVVEDSSGRLHGKDGKFIAKEKSEEQDEEDEVRPPDAVTPTEDDPLAYGDEEEEVDEDLPLETDDPDILSFLTKYGNDPVKALKAATEAQKLIGRQGSELSELRALKDQISQLENIVGRFPTPDPYRLADEGRYAEAAQAAVNGGNADAVMAVLESWKEEDPFSAAVFWSNLQTEFRLEQIRSAQSPTQTEDGDQALAQAVGAVIREYPDIEQHLPAIGEVLQGSEYLQAALATGDPETRAQVLKDAYLLARGRNSDTLTQAAQSKVKSATRQAASKARADAAVVSASRGTAASDQLSGVDEFKRQFMLATKQIGPDD